jgi:serine/threonine protein kinase
VADYVRAGAVGQDVSAQAWPKANPELLAELAAELKKAELLGAACRRAIEGAPAASVDPSLEPTRGCWATGDSPLRVRCPHCHNPITIADDVPLTGIVCNTCDSSFSLLQDTQATPAARKVAHFELVERLGGGGFGTVWKARDTKLDRTVAIKIPREGRLGTPEVEQSFFREARAAAQLKHPGIVSVHEVGREGDTIYIVSDLVRGASLSEWLSATKPTAREAAELCAKLADALHHAHQAGVVHRDLKPSNIMIDLEGAPHIMDFGLALRDAGESTVTIDGEKIGTPAYMSPEQARGEAHHADRRSDVYSLGVILFQLLTGELPFRGHAQMLLVQILWDEPPKPRALKASVPRDLQTICLKCLEKEPARRYATAADLAADLWRLLRGEAIRARPITQAGRFYRWCRREPAIAALSAGLLVAMAAGIIAVAGSWYAVPAAEGRQEAVFSLGDFRRFDPITIESRDRSITVCSLHPQGKLLAIGHQDGHISLYNSASGFVIWSIESQGKPIRALSFAGAGDRLLSVDDSGRVRECTIEPTKRAKKPPNAIEVFRVDF